MKTIRIFISSPGDVAEERERARQVIDSLKRRYLGKFQLVTVLWEDLPLQADQSFQEGIDRVVTDEHGIDIAVFILWSRLGSPLGASVRKPDGSPYRSGTEREFDLMLHAREISQGARPSFLVYTRQDEATFEERLRGKSTAEKQEILEQKELIEHFIKEEFHESGSGHNRRAFHTFQYPQSFSLRFRTHLIALLDEMAGADSAGAIWDVATQGPPFVGLQSFDNQHAQVFCGREAEILESRQLLSEQARKGRPFLLISGASGSGKSSLARAGLLPTIAEFELDDQVAEWRQLTVLPSALGDDLLGALIEQLARPTVLPELREGGIPLSDVVEAFKKDAETATNLTIKRALYQASKDRGGGTRLLILIDQLEEIFTLSSERREPFLTAIEALVGTGDIWVVATVRSDFLGGVQQSPSLVRLISGGGLFPLAAPQVDDLRRIIEEPAYLAGLRYEKKNGRSLSDQILADATQHTDPLPLLQYVLRELYDRRSSDGHLLTSVYEELGGVEGALVHRADATLSGLSSEVQASLPLVLRHLVSLGKGDQSSDSLDGQEQLIRQYVPLATFPEGGPARELVDALIRERLLTAEGENSLSDTSEQNSAIVTLAHEALLRVWPTAITWANENRDLLRIRGRIDSRLREDSPLLSGDPLLDMAKHFLHTHADAFSDEQREFIQNSVAAEEGKLQRSIRIRRVVIAVLTVLTLLASLAAYWAFKREQDARTARAISEQRRIAAEEARTKAERAQELAEQRRVAAIESERREKLAREKSEKAQATAEKLINSMLFDLHDKLKPLGRIELLDDVSLEAEKYFEENPPSTDDAKYNQSIMWESRANVLYATGDLGGAKKAYQESLNIVGPLADHNPKDIAIQYARSSILNKLARVTKDEGDLEASLQLYQNSLHYSESLAKTYPDSSLAQRALFLSLSEMGSIYQSQGDLLTAQELYERALLIVEALAKTETADITIRQNSGVVLSLLGDVVLETGKVTQAHDYLKKALEIRQKMLEDMPSDSGAQQDLATSYERMAQISEVMGDTAATKENYQREHQIIERLAETDPKNALAQRNWSVSLENLGRVALLEDDFPTANQFYTKALQIRKKLGDFDSENAEARQNLASVVDKIGEIELRQGNLQEAEKQFRLSLQIRETLANANPKDAMAQKNWNVSLTNLSRIAQARGDSDTALKLLEQALKISEEQAKSNPDNPGLQRTWSISLDLLGHTLQEKGDNDAARQAFQKALEISERLARENPNHIDYQQNYSSSLFNLASWARSINNLTSAVDYFQKSLAISQEIARSAPDDLQIQQNSAITSSALADLAMRNNDLSAARKYRELTIDIYGKILKSSPDNAQFQSSFAQALVALGRLSLSESKIDEADQLLQKGEAILRNLTASNPDNTATLYNWMVSLDTRADVSREKQDFLTAIQLLEKVVEGKEKIASSKPESLLSQRDWTFSIIKLGKLIDDKGDANRAKPRFEKAISILTKLLGSHPENLDVKSDLDYALNMLASLYEKKGDLKAQVALCEQSLKLRKELMDKKPNDFQSLWNCSVTLDTLGRIAVAEKEFQKAHRYFQESHDIQKKLSEEHRENEQALRLR